MRGLYRFLPPFSPDQSGAVSVLFELGGIIVVLDAGGCTGNICGFDEPRWFSKKSAIYSAGLRDMDAIMGRDDRLVDKLKDAIDTAEPRFIAFIGTPVPSVIATDYNAVCKMAEKRYGIPAIYIETTGMKLYENGQLKAYKAVKKMVDRAISEHEEALDTPYTKLYEAVNPDAFSVPDVAVWGATSLSLPSIGSAEALRSRLACEGKRAITIGMDSGLEGYFLSAKVKEHRAVSNSGYAFAKALVNELGQGYELTKGFCMESMIDLSRAGKKLLVVHQQIFANEVRKMVTGPREVHVASFFGMEKELMQEGDLLLKGETEFIKLVRDGGYDTLVADPLYFRAIKNMEIEKIPLPHFAVSGSVYESNTEEEYFRKIARGEIL